MAPSTLTEPTTYEHVLAQFRLLSDEEQQQFMQRLGKEQSITPNNGTNGTEPTQQAQPSSPLPLDEHITSNPLYQDGDSLMQSLTAATAQNDTRTFVDLIRDLDWSQRTPEEMHYTIDLSFQMMMSRISLDLVKKAADLFPDYAEFQRLKRGFFPENPSRKSQKKRGRMKGLKESYDWLDQHADQYVGKLVAVNQGVLIGAASTYKELEEMIQDVEDPDSTLVHKVI